jgi:hypothetical protein
VDASSKTFLYAIIFIIFAFVLSIWLPSAGNLETNKSLAINQEVEMIPRHVARRRGFIFAIVLAVIVGVISYNAGEKKEKKEILAETATQTAQNSAVPADALQTIPIIIRGPDPVVTP